MTESTLIDGSKRQVADRRLPIGTSREAMLLFDIFGRRVVFPRAAGGCSSSSLDSSKVGLGDLYSSKARPL